MLLLLLSCVLFQSGAIDCAAGEACLDSELGESGLDDSEQVVDTSPPAAAPTLSGVVLVDKAGDQQVLGISPDGSLTKLWAGAGALDFSVQDDADILGVRKNGEVFSLSTENWVADLGLDVVDLSVVDGQAVIATRTGLYRQKAGTVAQISTVSFQDLRLIAPDGAQGLYAVEYLSGSLRLLHGTSGGWQTVHAAYDDRVDRSVDLFVGQADAPMSCGRDGAAYLLEDLAWGETTPWRAPNEPVDDVLACGFDKGSQEILLLSAGQGVLRVAADGSVSTLAFGQPTLSGFFFE